VVLRTRYTELHAMKKVVFVVDATALAPLGTAPTAHAWDRWNTLDVQRTWLRCLDALARTQRTSAHAHDLCTSWHQLRWDVKVFATAAVFYFPSRIPFDSMFNEPVGDHVSSLCSAAL